MSDKISFIDKVRRRNLNIQESKSSSALSSSKVNKKQEELIKTTLQTHNDL
jgi:hypothetical protein